MRREAPWLLIERPKRIEPLIVAGDRGMEALVALLGKWEQ
jgi:hypothetical protein